jgi:hypothetical protein
MIVVSMAEIAVRLIKMIHHWVMGFIIVVTIALHIATMIMVTVMILEYLIRDVILPPITW